MAKLTKPNAAAEKAPPKSAKKEKKVKTAAKEKVPSKKTTEAVKKISAKVPAKPTTKRVVQKDKVHQLKLKVEKGDEAARKELEELIKKLEAQKTTSKRSRRKLNMYKNILKPKTGK
ncbi:uncharacterized protein LOC116162367 [Photinus pyralis]|uniref:uncharacterized protein LOC116162367 n=1 Tax=Photinus pyralis TaxID=7054 RepID=UPI0012677A08|nr:uncharacterized protein LOC116162367 [Photinus pyralis]